MSGCERDLFFFVAMGVFERACGGYGLFTIVSIINVQLEFWIGVVTCDELN
jgi:hypothetical protein